MIKNIAKALIVSLFFAFTMTSCELLGNCKTCSKVTYVDGVETNRTPGVLYCGDKLEEIESESPVTIGSTTTQWECD